MPYTGAGLVGGVMLALGRALGETMAVTFVIGNAHRIHSVDPRPRHDHFGDHRQRIHRSRRRALHLLADRAGPRAVRHHLHRAGGLAADAGAAQTTGGPLMSLATIRKARSAIAMGACIAATVLGLTALALILGALLWNGFSSLNLDVFTKMTPPPGAARRLAQRHRRLADHDHPRRRHRRAARPVRRHLHGGIRPVFEAHHRGALHQRHPAVGAFDRHRPVRL